MTIAIKGNANPPSAMLLKSFEELIDPKLQGRGMVCEYNTFEIDEFWLWRSLCKNETF